MSSSSEISASMMSIIPDLSISILESTSIEDVEMMMFEIKSLDWMVETKAVLRCDVIHMTKSNGYVMGSKERMSRSVMEDIVHSWGFKAGNTTSFESLSNMNRMCFIESSSLQ
jgi:hypothetical protein